MRHGGGQGARVRVRGKAHRTVPGPGGVCGTFGVRGKAGRARWRAQGPAEVCVLGAAHIDKVKNRKVVGHPRLAGSQERGGLVGKDDEHAVLVGQRWLSSNTAPGSQQP